MKLLITGSSGQLGHALSRISKIQHIDIFEGDLPHFDILDAPNTEKKVLFFQPDIIINAAAYTLVDQSENEADKAFAINQDGPATLAGICRTKRIPLIHISTDYVFDGKKGTAYIEDDPVSPLGVYGKSKEAGEKEIRKRLTEHVIMRTSWLYGIHGNNFVKTMLKLGKERDVVRVVSDQKGSPTCAEDLAEAIINVAKKILSRKPSRWGTYHYCNSGVISWYEFAQSIFQIAACYDTFKVDQVIPITTAEYPTLTTRPPFSALNCEKIRKNFDIEQKPWKESLEQTIKTIVSPG
ncbi:MAG: dTDP-4-dehydrorhamnose reductase [Proteobacteria bacterium]|nr:dTDP-4-dehydrorhamnose reductase [Pseudomonadota bacterium]